MKAKVRFGSLLASLSLAFLASCQATHPTTVHPAAVEAVMGAPATATPATFAAVSDDGRFRAEQGGLVKLGGHLWDIQGDYDGNTVVVAEGTDVVIVPDYDATAGPEIGFGYRGEVYGFELTYKRFESEGEFGGFTEDDTWNYLDLDFREFFRTSSRLQPYISLGVGYFFGTIVDGATDGVVLEDSDFSGISINAGGGLAFYFSERLALDVRAIYRYAETLDVDTVSFGTLSIDDGLPANAFGVSFGLTYVLN